ncbi:erythromycin esterase family protein [uncultured Aquimarina sp.]|uniref:erythromycin esterase family protein n=1 Tax=uncultured Aquimarina sp. TaxID=575652 RepID=UPI0026377ECE|nr:erythromycin esterase family protein [uncultured Aquimarina sp.]
MRKSKKVCCVIIRFKIICLLVLAFPYKNFSQNSHLSFQKGGEKTLIGDEKHSYNLSLKKGDFLQLHLQQKDVNLQVLALSSSKDTIQVFLDNYREDGLEIVEFPVKKSGMYTFKVSPYISKWLKDSARENFINSINGSYIVEKFNTFSPKEYKTLLKLRKAQKDSVINWISDKSITLKGVKAETGFEDLSQLKPVLRNVKVVGMGETSHGAKEIFQMKHRMFEFLVKEMGFTLFGLEASYIGCKPINDYVLYGKGNSRDALSAQGFWIWNVESIVDLIEWMHDYNKTVPESKKVKFIGIDTQTNGLDIAYRNISDFIGDSKDNPLLDINVDSLFHSIRTVKSKNDLSVQRQQLYRTLSYIIVNEIRLVNKSSKQEYLNVISDLKKVIQGVEAGDLKLRDKVDYNIRDEFMAQTILEELNKKGQEAKMMIWAHNGHINKDPKSYTNGSQKPLGSILKQYLGDSKYYAIGFSTYQGSFQARSYIEKDSKYKYGKVGSFRIYPRDEENLDWYFLQSRKDRFFLDFKQKPKNGAINSFLNKNLDMHSAGSIWTFERKYSPISEIIPDKYFDGMIFIKETSSAVLTPNGEIEIQNRIEKGK